MSKKQKNITSFEEALFEETLWGVEEFFDFEVEDLDVPISKVINTKVEEPVAAKEVKEDVIKEIVREPLIQELPSREEFRDDSKICEGCIGDGYVSKSRTENFLEKSENGVDVIFVGAPWPMEDQSNLESCTMLENMIKAMKLDPAKVAKAALFNCQASEPTCFQKVIDEIALLNPKIIVTMGAYPTNTILGSKERMTKVHGQLLERTLNSSFGAIKVTVMPTFHPDFLIINPNMKRTTWMDLQKVMEFISRS